MKSLIDMVIVTYNPNIALLMKTINTISSQVRQIIVVDNKSDSCDIEFELSGYALNLIVISMSDNLGIAYAQNIGIQRSIENHSDYIVLSDQDTIYPTDYIEKMLLVYEKQINNVAAIAPLFHDAVGQNKNDGFFILSTINYFRIYPMKGLHQIHQAIASGLIIKSSVFDCIGVMDTMLFIDWVDYEWCWRARAKGYVILGNADVLIEHNLGDFAIKVCSKRINLRGAIRHYYITRNAFHLAWRSPYLDIWHRLNLVLKGISYIVGYSILAKPRITNLKMTLLGLWHSVVGRLGRLD